MIVVQSSMVVHRPNIFSDFCLCVLTAIPYLDVSLCSKTITQLSSHLLQQPACLPFSLFTPNIPAHLLSACLHVPHSAIHPACPYSACVMCPTLPFPLYLPYSYWTFLASPFTHILIYPFLTIKHQLSKTEELIHLK